MPGVNIFDSGGGGTDDDAIHDNVAAEISAIAEKTAPVAADLLLIEDSAAANAKKKLQIGNFPPQDMSVRCTMSGNQTIAHDTNTSLLWDTETWDTDSMHSVASNTERLVAPVTGKYIVVLGISWGPAVGAGYKTIQIRNSAAAAIAASHVAETIAGDRVHSCTALVTLAAADYVYGFGYQTSGGNLDVTAGTGIFFGMALLGEV